MARRSHFPWVLLLFALQMGPLGLTPREIAADAVGSAPPAVTSAAVALAAVAPPAASQAASVPSAACASSDPQQAFIDALAQLLAFRRSLPDHFGFTAVLQWRWGPVWEPGTLWGDLDRTRLKLSARWPPLPPVTRVYRLPSGAVDSSWRGIAAQASGSSCQLSLQQAGGQRAEVWFNRRVQPQRAVDQVGAWRISAEFFYPPSDGRALSLLPSAATVRVEPLGLQVIVQVTDIWLDRAPPGMPGE